jgi:hypothetical protein
MLIDMRETVNCKILISVADFRADGVGVRTEFGHRKIEKSKNRKIEKSKNRKIEKSKNFIA